MPWSCFLRWSQSRVVVFPEEPARTVLGLELRRQRWLMQLVWVSQPLVPWSEAPETSGASWLCALCKGRFPTKQSCKTPSRWTWRQSQHRSGSEPLLRPPSWSCPLSWTLLGSCPSRKCLKLARHLLSRSCCDGGGGDGASWFSLKEPQCRSLE